MEQEESYPPKETSPYDIDAKIKNRDSWLKIAVIGIFSVVIAYKVLLTPIDLSAFNFSDLLSLLLALFAMWMSVAFYFKATDTSTQFYDNTYKFTKDVSEILGRIEAGFGEKLKHIDEGYSGIREQIEKINSVAEKEGQKEQEIKEKEIEKQKILEDALSLAKNKDEKIVELLTRFQKKDEELAKASNELEGLKYTLNNLNRQVDTRTGLGGLRRAGLSDFGPKPGFLAYLRKLTIKYLGGFQKAYSLPLSEIANKFNLIKTALPKQFITDGKTYGVFDEEGNMTIVGANLVKNFYLSEENSTNV